jgi:hypothetical protein
MENLLNEKKELLEKKDEINGSFVSNKPKKFEFVYDEKK